MEKNMERPDSVRTVRPFFLRAPRCMGSATQWKGGEGSDSAR